MQPYARSESGKGSRCVRRIACTVVVLCAAVAVIRAAPALAASPLSWSAPASVDEQPEPLGMSAVTCPTSSLCVGGDYAGHIVTSTDPLSASPSWSAVTVPGAGVPVEGVSCASATLCVAVGWASVIPIGGPPPPQEAQILSSTDPTGTGSAWNVASVDGPEADGTTALDDISCVASLCVAGGSGSESGAELAVSTDPTGGAADWNVFSVAPATWYVSGVSCVSASFCVAVDSAGDVLTSTDPTGGSSAWSVTHIPGEEDFAGVSCPTATLCVAVDELGNLVTSTDPTGGAGAWTVVSGADPDPYGYEGVACASASVCAAVDNDGDVISASDPTGGASAWSSASITGAGGLDVVSCIPGSSACVASGDGDLPTDGAVIDSRNATDGAGSWSAHANPDGLTGPSGPRNTITSVSCIAGPLCVGVDDAGNVVTSTDPAGGAAGWQLIVGVDGSTAISSVSCIAGPLCVAVDADGNVLTSTDPAGGADAWSLADVDNGTPILTVSCVSGPVCVAGDGEGNELRSTDPTGGPSAWSAQPLGAASFSAVSCTSAALCVGVNGNAGTVAASEAPLGSAADWTDEGDLTPFASPPTGIFCLAGPFCLAIDAEGEVSSTNDPLDAAPDAWSTTGVLEQPAPFPASEAQLTSVTCAAVDLCLASDEAGAIFETSDPSGPASAWTMIYDNQPADTISCVSSELCVAAGPQGFVEYAVASPPPPPPAEGLTVQFAGTGSGTVSEIGTDCDSTCTLDVGQGAVVSLSAVAAPGSTFAGWSGGGCSGLGSCTVTVNSATTVTATFVSAALSAHPPAPVPVPTVAYGELSFAFTGSGGGRVSGAGITCSADCTHSLPRGTVTLSASAAPGSRFVGWGGVCAGSGSCTLTLGATASVTADFAALDPTATIRRVEVAATAVTIEVSRGGDATRLQCALLRGATQRSDPSARSYRSCGPTITYRRLRAGSYVLYVRAVSADGAKSRPVTHRFTIR